MKTENLKITRTTIFPLGALIALIVASASVSVSGAAQEAVNADGGTGLQVNAAVDTVFQTGEVQEARSDRFDVREAEVGLFAPIDPTFDGQLTLAAHQEEGEAVFELHEAYIGSTRLIPRSRFRLGRYFLGVGRLNQFHRHDWPFVSAPKVQRDFFDSEGLNDTGLEYGILLPLPFYLDLTAGITNGWTFGHSHTEGDKPRFPTHYARLATYFGLPGDGGMQTGLNYVGRKAAGSVDQSYVGLDATAKWREARTLKFLAQSEVWLRSLKPQGASSEKTLGLYVFPQLGASESVFFGLRGDYFSVLDLKDASGAGVSNATIAVVPTLTYRSSEFATLRAAYTRQWTSLEGTETQSSGLLELQATFILGTHPAHDF